MSNLTYTIDLDQIIRAKIDIFNDYSVLYAKLINLKGEFADIDKKYQEERFILLLNAKDTKFQRKDDVEAVVYKDIPKELFDQYKKLEKEIKITELQLERAHNQGKQLQDIIVAMGIQQKTRGALASYKPGY